ncbi:MAG: hypothetical protein ACI8TQ_002397 [Planctomycetota bacterium]|jgi:hypothetical protein
MNREAKRLELVPAGTAGRSWCLVRVFMNNSG